MNLSGPPEPEVPAQARAEGIVTTIWFASSDHFIAVDECRTNAISGVGNFRTDRIMLAVQMLEARRAMRGLFGDDYARLVEPFRRIFRDLQLEKEKPVLEVCHAIMQALHEAGYDEQIAVAVSAAMDEIESGAN